MYICSSLCALFMQSAQGALSASLLLVTSLTEGKESEGQSLLLGHCQSLVEALQAVLSALRFLFNIHATSSSD